jgi:hypothetical protein
LTDCRSRVYFCRYRISQSEKEASNMAQKLEVVVIAVVDSARRPVDGWDV